MLLCFLRKLLSKHTRPSVACGTSNVGRGHGENALHPSPMLSRCFWSFLRPEGLESKVTPGWAAAGASAAWSTRPLASWAGPAGCSTRRRGGVPIAPNPGIFRSKMTNSDSSPPPSKARSSSSPKDDAGLVPTGQARLQGFPAVCPALGGQSRNTAGQSASGVY